MSDPNSSRMNIEGARCPGCSEAFAPGDRFCEACGSALPEPDELCVACGGVVNDGYCDHCGLKQPLPRDHIELTWPGIGAVTDKGKHHWRNEDAFGVVPGSDRVAVIVCDGVSSSVRADEASQAAVDAALVVLAESGAGGLPDAYRAAREAVVALPWTPMPDLSPPSCTYLAVVVTDELLSWTSMGDCRLYWVADGLARQCTVDDSVASELVRMGDLAPEEAPAHDGYHVVTRWLADDADPTWEPELHTLEINGPGRVVCCSDGLWNYTLQPADLSAAMGDPSDDPRETARRLTQHALTGGGHDNIAVVVVDVPLSGGAQPA